MMKTGMDLPTLARTIEERRVAKADYRVSNTQLRMLPDARTLEVEDVGQFGVRDLALQQIGTHTSIPIPFLRRLQADEPELLATNVNTLLRNQKKASAHMLRTMFGDTRAFLSDRYQRRDYEHVFNAVGPVLAEVGQREGGIKIASCDITETHFYMKAVFPGITGVVTKSKQVGDVIEAGVLIKDSEVGLGSVDVSPFARRLVCLNGMTREGGQKWRHLGRRLTESDAVYALISDEAREADDHALMLLIRDTTRAILNREVFDNWIASMNDATELKITGDIPKAVEKLAATVGLQKMETSAVLRALIEAGDLSKWGLANAVTLVAGQSESYDRASALEAVGSDVIDLSPHEWHEIATQRA